MQLEVDEETFKTFCKVFDKCLKGSGDIKVKDKLVYAKYFNYWLIVSIQQEGSLYDQMDADLSDAGLIDDYIDEGLLKEVG